MDTKLPVFNADAQTAYIDMRSDATNGEGRQVVVLGDPSINANVAAVLSQDGLTSDETTPAIAVRSVGSLAVSIAGSSGTMGVYLSGTAGTIHTYLDPATTLEGIQSSISVHLVGTAGTIHTYLDPSTTLEGIQSSIMVRIQETAGTLIVKTDPSAVLAGITSSINVHLVGTTGTVWVKNDPSSTIAGITSSITVHLVGTSGTLWVKPDPAGTYFTNGAHTASIFTVTGSTSGGTTSGVTLVAPSANYSFKVFAYSIQSTATVDNAWRFTNGGGSETELWRPLVSDGGSGVGANLAVQPPGFIFATGTSVTLALKSDAGSLVHYSVSYIKESA